MDVTRLAHIKLCEYEFCLLYPRNTGFSFATTKPKKKNWTLIKILTLTPLCVICSGSDRRIWCRKEQPAVPLHQKRVQPWHSHNHRGGVQHADSAAQQLHHQGPDLGHSRAGAIPGHHFCVSLKIHHSSYRPISIYMCTLTHKYTLYRVNILFF